MGWLGREGLKFRVGCFRQKEVDSEDHDLKLTGIVTSGGMSGSVGFSL